VCDPMRDQILEGEGWRGGDVGLRFWDGRVGFSIRRK
jgi:hypothetical protein